MSILVVELFLGDSWFYCCLHRCLVAIVVEFIWEKIGIEFFTADKIVIKLCSKIFQEPKDCISQHQWLAATTVALLPAAAGVSNRGCILVVTIAWVNWLMDWYEITRNAVVFFNPLEQIIWIADLLSQSMPSLCSCTAWQKGIMLDEMMRISTSWYLWDKTLRKGANFVCDTL
jgi:hypothetical protein